VKARSSADSSQKRYSAKDIEQWIAEDERVRAAKGLPTFEEEMHAVDEKVAQKHAADRKNEELVNDAGVTPYKVAEQLEDMRWPHGALYRALYDVLAAKRRLTPENRQLVEAWIAFQKSDPKSPKIDTESHWKLRGALFDKRIPPHEKYKLLQAHAAKYKTAETFKRFKVAEDDRRREAAIIEAKNVIAQRDAQREQLMKSMQKRTGRSNEGLLRDAVDALLRKHNIDPPGTPVKPKSKVVPMVFN
jgi:hypothetical protein